MWHTTYESKNPPKIEFNKVRSGPGLHNIVSSYSRLPEGFYTNKLKEIKLKGIVIMVTWKRTLSISGPNNQASITLPKRWVESVDLESGQKLEIEEMKREKALKIRVSND